MRGSGLVEGNGASMEAKINKLGKSVMAALGVAGVLVLGASNADSQIILTPPVGQAQAPTNPHITGSSGSYQWAYSISIGYGTQISSGDSFAITDFGDFTNPTFTAASGSY